MAPTYFSFLHNSTSQSLLRFFLSLHPPFLEKSSLARPDLSLATLLFRFLSLLSKFLSTGWVLPRSMVSSTVVPTMLSPDMLAAAPAKQTLRKYISQNHIWHS